MNVFDNIQGTAHVVAESSRLKATTAGHIYDLKMIEDTDNGSIVAVGAHVEGQVFKAKTMLLEMLLILFLHPLLHITARRLGPMRSIFTMQMVRLPEHTSFIRTTFSLFLLMPSLGHLRLASMLTQLTQ